MKIKALKAQLNFQKRVLEQTHENKEIFHVTKHGKQLSVHDQANSPQDSTVSSPHRDLVGKRIRHKWVDEEGKEEWFCGCILSLVPGTLEWFNVQYNGEEEILTLNLYRQWRFGHYRVKVYVYARINNCYKINFNDLLSV